MQLSQVYFILNVYTPYLIQWLYVYFLVIYILQHTYNKMNQSCNYTPKIMGCLVILIFIKLNTFSDKLLHFVANICSDFFWTLQNIMYPRPGCGTHILRKVNKHACQKKNDVCRSLNNIVFIAWHIVICIVFFITKYMEVNKYLVDVFWK
jgi:flagellar biosynthesis protein FliQ